MWGEGGAAPPPTVSARKGGHTAGLPQTCLEKKGARAQGNLCSSGGAPQEKRLGTPPHPGMKGPKWTPHERPRLLGKEWGWGGLFFPPPPTPSLGHPTPGEGPLGGRPGARQPPGPPAAVALVTTPANWPAERAGGSCSGREGQGHRLSRALGAEGWGAPRRRAGRVGGQPITLGHCLGSCGPPPTPPLHLGDTPQESLG